MKMTREEAIKAMLDGKKVRGIYWPQGEYCCYDESKNRPFRYVGYSPDCDEILLAWCSKEWELYEEPKKKVKMWQWIMQDEDNIRAYLTDYFYKDELEAIECEAKHSKLIGKAEWTEIEADE